MRILLAAFCLFAFLFTWVAMNVSELYIPPGGQIAHRLPLALQKSVTGDLPAVATVLCTLNALSQYGFRHSVRRIIEEGKPDPPGGFRWMRALQSVVIAWVLWYATLIAHCLK